ncbi:MAG TPA: flippase activity-associated protein Agl23 [Pyrinomonadaceae bacterium]|nr:flippase activity-associated protein Agl23 [Pyrinomonadaceae bacterium]
MSTASTKSRPAKNAKAGRGSARASGRASETLAGPESGQEIPERVWLFGRILVLNVAAFLRLYNLALVPLHHDEGVNGNFLMRLFREGYYHYDPANYHGPTLYYFALLTTYIFGPTTFAIRLLPALFGIATVWLVLCLRWKLGTLAALAGAALLAVSPGAVYMSRYFIHESLFVFFTLAIVYAALKYWDEANPYYLVLAAIFAALLFATKETAIINAGVLVIALGLTVVYAWLRKQGVVKSSAEETVSSRSRAKAGVAESLADEPRGALERLGGPTSVLLISGIAVAVFIAVNVIFYSSFFSNAKGVNDALETFKFWTKTGKKEHVHEWYTYLNWLWQEEAPLLLLGAAGIILAAWRGSNRLAIFIALWAFGILSAYSLVPYKTPWLVLNFIVPLAITGGYAIEVIYKTGEERQLFGRVLALSLLVTSLSVCVYQTVSLNFFNYDDDHYPYVYAHTRRETLALVDEIERLAKRAGTGDQTGITIVSPDYWPLPWYLRDYKRVGYFGQMTMASEPLIISREDQSAQLQASLGDGYRKVGSYALRPGVTLVLYARRDIESK